MSNTAINFEYWEEGRPIEMFDGKVYNMAQASIRHGAIASNIRDIFKAYLKGKRCRVFQENTTVFFEKGKNETVPDVMVVCDPEKIGSDGIYGAPDFIAEVSSPSTARFDRTKKMSLYESHGVKEYWIVSQETKTIEIYLLKEGKLVLDDVFSIPPAWQLRHSSEAEIAALTRREIKTPLFDDLTIDMEEVYYNVFEDYDLPKRP